MNHAFDNDYWDQIWTGDRATGMSASAPNPHLLTHAADLPPGAAIDAGCGAGAEAIWLATQGWKVTAADIARAALAFGRERAAGAGIADQVEWVQADLSTWQPDTTYDLVTTHYAHPTIPQLEFYGRIARWVAPGGTLLIVGHLHPDQRGKSKDDHGQEQSHGHGRVSDAEHEHDGDSHPPAAASATAAAIVALLDPALWEVVTAEESQRPMAGPGGHQKTIHDVVVRARRA